MIEFAEQEEKKGSAIIDAALEAARIRLRPILMTSFAFIFGVLPLALSTGAGANSRIAIGTSVIGGMLTATLLAIFYIPLFFVLVRRGVRDGLAAVRERIRSAGPPKLEEARPLFSRLLATGCRRCSRPMCVRTPRPGVLAGRATPTSGRPRRRCRRSPTATSSADPRLQALIEQALVNNRDLMIAAANIAAAREQYRIQRAQQLPQVDASASATGDAGGTNDGNGVSTRYNLGVGIAGFELDLFGRLRSLTDAQRNRYLATEAGSSSDPPLARFRHCDCVADLCGRRQSASDCRRHRRQRGEERPA